MNILQKRQGRDHAGTGHTLIELLVAIAIIAIVLSLVFATVSKIWRAVYSLKKGISPQPATAQP